MFALPQWVIKIKLINSPFPPQKKYPNYFPHRSTRSQHDALSPFAVSMPNTRVSELPLPWQQICSGGWHIPQAISKEESGVQFTTHRSLLPRRLESAVKIVPLDVTKGGGTTPFILKLGTRWRWAISFTPLLLNPGETTSETRWGRGKKGRWAPHSYWAFWKTEIFLALTGNQTPDRQASTLVTIHTTPFQLQKSTKIDYTTDRPAFCHTDGGYTFLRNVGIRLHVVISYYSDLNDYQGGKLIYQTTNAVLYWCFQWFWSQEIGKDTCIYRTTERLLTHSGHDKFNTHGSHTLHPSGYGLMRPTAFTYWQNAHCGTHRKYSRREMERSSRLKSDTTQETEHCPMHWNYERVVESAFKPEPNTKAQKSFVDFFFSLLRLH